jgi:chromosome segregation ATPase
MNQEQKALLKEVVTLYEDLGILDSPADTALGMVEAVESEILLMESRLVGDKPEVEDAEMRLEELRREREEILREIKDIDFKLKKYDPDFSELSKAIYS